MAETVADQITAESQVPKKKRRLHRPHPIRFARAHKAGLGRVLIVLLALIACALPVPFVNNVFGYLPLLVLVLAILLSFVYLRIIIHGFSFSEDSLLPSCERGQEIEFVVHFKNATFLPFLRLEPTFFISDLFGETDVSIPASMPLMPFEERDFSFEARFDHIGTYEAGVQQVMICDLLGLFSKTIVNDKRHEVEVLPRLFDVSRVELTNVASQETNKAFQPLVTDDMDYAGVREYQWGDPLKTIHWKLSGRSLNENYFTRLFETFTNPGLTIILDTTADQTDNESLMFMFDGLIESALSVNFYARKQGIDSEIVYTNRYHEQIHARILNLEESDDLIADIPRINIGDGSEARELLRRECNSIHGQDNVAFCTSHISEEAISALVNLRMHKRNPILFVVIPRGLGDDEVKELLRPLRRLEAQGIVYYAISGAEDLQEGEGR